MELQIIMPKGIKETDYVIRINDVMYETRVFKSLERINITANIGDTIQINRGKTVASRPASDVYTVNATTKAIQFEQKKGNTFSGIVLIITGLLLLFRSLLGLSVLQSNAFQIVLIITMIIAVGYSFNLLYVGSLFTVKDV